MRDLEHSARFWLRAYPRHWRAERADEVTAVLLDLAPDGARRLDARTALGLLRGGIATRWRGTPSPRVYLPYRLLGLRVPPEHREWVYRDLTTPGYQRRDLLWRSWVFALPLYASVVGGRWGDTLTMWAVIGLPVLATVLVVRWAPARRRRLVHHVRPRAGEQRQVGALTWIPIPQVRLAAGPAARAWAVVLAVGAVSWSTAALVAPATIVARPCDAAGGLGCTELGAGQRTGLGGAAAVLALAAVIGLLLAVVVGRRLRRRLPMLPEQPARVLVGPSRSARVGIALWCVLIVAAALAEATGAWVLSLSLVAGPACLALLPSAVVRAAVRPVGAVGRVRRPRARRPARSGRPRGRARAAPRRARRVAAGDPMTIDPRFERSVQRWLRAYPRRWRTARGAEMTALLADLSEPGATRLDAASALGLVRSGWATRLRTRPPLHQYLAYRVLDRRLPAAYRGWARDDIDGAFYLLRRVGQVPLIMVAVPMVASGSLDFPARTAFVSVLVFTAMMLVLGGIRRRADARRHLVPDSGEPWTEGDLVYGWVSKDRVRARPALGLLVVLAAVVTASGLLGGVMVAPVAGAAALGAVAALVVRVRLVTVVPHRPVQGARRLVEPRARASVALVLLGALAVTAGWAGTSLSPVLAVVGAALLPGLVVAWRFAATAPDDLALVDVRSIVLTGSVPPVDRLVEGLVPAVLSTD